MVWEKDGKVIESSGVICEAEDCPCGTTPPVTFTDCGDWLDWMLANFTSAAVSFSAAIGGAGDPSVEACRTADCPDLGGSYVLSLAESNWDSFMAFVNFSTDIDVTVCGRHYVKILLQFSCLNPYPNEPHNITAVLYALDDNDSDSGNDITLAVGGLSSSSAITSDDFLTMPPLAADSGFCAPTADVSFSLS
jgi:hypothetical protein